LRPHRLQQEFFECNSVRLTGNKNIDKIVGFLRLIATSTNFLSSPYSKLVLQLLSIREVRIGQSIGTASKSGHFSDTGTYDR
jgi:hypothetical protein